jgi:hypothetical protein
MAFHLEPLKASQAMFHSGSNSEECGIQVGEQPLQLHDALLQLHSLNRTIARSCRFRRGARLVAILGFSLPEYTSAIRRALASRTANTLSRVGSRAGFHPPCGTT